MKSPFFIDLQLCIKRLPMVTYMAYSDTRARYKRSVLGPLWLTCGAAIGVVGLGFVWSTILNQNRAEFIPSLTIGLLIWQFLSGCVTESCGSFVRQSQIIRNLKLPLLIHPIQLIMRQLITLVHNLIVVIAVFLFYNVTIDFNVLYSFLGLLIVLGNLGWISILLGMIGARFRDLEQAIIALMPILFFLTPVIYRVGHGGFDIPILWLNPFTYFISIIRDPVMGQVELANYMVSTGIMIFGWVVTGIFFNKNHKRLAFWI